MVAPIFSSPTPEVPKRSSPVPVGQKLMEKRRLSRNWTVPWRANDLRPLATKYYRIGQVLNFLSRSFCSIKLFNFLIRRYRQTDTHALQSICISLYLSQVLEG
jgi:hypothetical protein